MRPIPILFFLFLSALADKRIIGGYEIDIKEAPYHVAIFAYGDFSGSGSIINHNTIITASHCVSGPAPADFTVRVGSSSYISGGTLVNVSNITKHPLFNQPIVFENDIAIMTLAENLTFGDSIQPLSLPAYAPAGGLPRFPNAGEEVFISGWGDTKTSGTLQAQLRAVTVDVLDRTECKARYSDYVIPITDGMFCNGVPGGGKGPCKGDSGGPVVLDGVLAGIVSWGLGCGSEQRPQVSTNVAYYQDWIAQVAAI
ncbi:trypsin-like serine protease [Aspergillus granulosus]|uniref:Trypsin-like serine protease n=1 Tax=Aspergillus granulosus TaxID=176169 RepID=A0ABR4H5C1_9EURO